MSNLVVRKEYKVELEFDPGSGRTIQETWRNQNGQLDRPNDLPAVQKFSPETGKRIEAQWFKDGRRHREGDQPADIATDDGTDAILRERYFFKVSVTETRENLLLSTEIGTGLLTGMNIRFTAATTAKTVQPRNLSILTLENIGRKNSGHMEGLSVRLVPLL